MSTIHDEDVFQLDAALAQLFAGDVRRAVETTGCWLAGMAALSDAVELPDLNALVSDRYERVREERVKLEAEHGKLPEPPHWIAAKERLANGAGAPVEPVEPVEVANEPPAENPILETVVEAAAEPVSKEPQPEAPPMPDEPSPKRKRR